MGKRKLSALVQAMNICEKLDERDRATLVDYLRSRLPVGKSQVKSTAPPAARKSSPRKPKAAPAANTATGSNGAGDVAEALAVATGRSVEEARAALDGNGGDKKLAMLALTAS